MEIVGSQPDVSELPLGGFMPNDDPVQILEINGLGPVKSEVSSSIFATGRGELFQGSSTGKRNIVLTVGLNPDWIDQTMTTLRQLLYQYFMVEQWVTLRFISDELPIVSIRGIVESFEPNIFAQDPEIQISILCNKPDFLDVDTTLVSAPASWDVVPIDYTGTAPSGFIVRVEANSGSYFGGLSVYNYTLNQHLFVDKIDVGPNKRFEMSSVRASRYVQNVIVSSNTSINLLGEMVPSSEWPELTPGNNDIVVVTDGGDLRWTLGYFNRYGGL